MKGRIFIYLLSAFLIVVFSQKVSCLDWLEYSVGTTFGYSKAFETVDYSSNTNINSCELNPGMVDTSFWRPNIGISADLKLLKTSIAKFSLIGRFSYQSFSFNETIPGDVYPSQVENSNNGYEIIPSITNHNFIVQYDLVLSNILINIDVLNTGFGILLGPSYSVVVNEHIKQEFNVVYPQNVQLKRPDNWQALGYKYFNNDRSVYVYDGKIPDVNSYRLGFVHGIQYEFKFDKIKFVPYISYD